jgi:predicted transcriptional regulator
MALPSSIMASAMIKSTYSLDPETVRRVERLATRWKVSKSEVVRRVVAVADKAPEVKENPADLTPLEAWRKVQKELNLTSAEVRAWEAESRRIRRTAFRKREWTRP